MKKDRIKHWFSLTRRIPFYWLIIIVLVGALPVNLYLAHPKIPVANVKEEGESCSLPYELVRETNPNRFIQPIRFVNVLSESDQYMSLKEKITTYLEAKKGGVLKSASVYFKNLNEADGWFAINADEKYAIASLLKVSFMIGILKEAEDHPALLDRKILFDQHENYNLHQSILEHPMRFGQYYSIKELLQYAICYSDNDAGYMLCDACKEATLVKLFSDLGMPPDDLNREYYCNVEEYSRLFRVLYNASYLSNDMSEYALELLTKSDFNEGMVKKLDKNLVIARKFGERGIGEEKQLHEFGLVYFKNQPYLLGILTHGSDNKQLEEVLSDISLMVYEEMNKPAL